MRASAVDARPRAGVLAVACTAQLLVVADVNAMTIALPSIGRSLGSSGVQWVLSAYTLCFGAFLLVGGRVADLWGRRRTAVCGAVGFGAAAVVSALAATLPLLVLARASQGIAAALLLPAALALMTAARPDAGSLERGITAFGGMVAVGFLAGVLGGGWLTQTAGWRAVPGLGAAGALALAAAAAALAPPDPPIGTAGRPPVLTPLLLVAGVLAFAFSIVRLGEGGMVGVAASIALVGAALRLDRLASEPLVPPSVRRSAGTRGAVFAALAALAGCAGLMYALTLYLQGVLGHEPLHAGRLFLAFSAGGLAAMLCAPRLLRRASPPSMLTAGLLVQAAGAGALAGLDHPSVIALFAAIATVGAGNVLATVAFTVMAIAGVPDADHGAAGGVIGAAQQVGVTLGLALVGSLIAGAASLRAGVDAALPVCAVLPLAAALVLAAWRPAAAGERP